MGCRRLILCAVIALTAAAAARGQATSQAGLDAFSRSLDGPHRIVNGRLPAFTWDIEVTVGPQANGAEPEMLRLTLVRRGDGEFACTLVQGASSRLTLLRTASVAALIDHVGRRVFLGEGPTPQGADALVFDAFTQRLAAAHGDLSAATEIIRGAADSRVMALQMIGMFKLVEQPSSGGSVILRSSEPINGRRFTITVDTQAGAIASIVWTSDTGTGRVVYRIEDQARLPELPGDGVETIRVDRVELERTLMRGAVRACEIAYRLDHPRPLVDRRRKDGSGLLIIRKARRIAMLAGTPCEIGAQHGKLLAREVSRTIDSLLYANCLYESLRRGSWALDECRKSWAAQSPQIAAEYKDEMAALAKAASVSLDEVQLVNTWPAMRRGTSFAMSGPASRGGKLIHGRVLDCLTGLDVQDTATLMLIRKQGSHPLVSVGYAGLIGCLDGMNGRKLAVSGGAGDGSGLWDSEPTPLVVRRLLERCSSADEALATLKATPRTAQVRYLISDGNTMRAATVVTSPDGVNVTELGQTSWNLGGNDVVAHGDNIVALLDGIRQNHRWFDEARTQALMCYPVAIQNENLHNILFLPADLVIVVSTASGRKDACTQPYFRYEFAQLLREAELVELMP
jgi:hypothetical protein